LGYDTTSGFIDYDTVSVNVNVNSNLDSVTFYPDTLYVQVQHYMPVNLTGFFANGNAYDVSNADGVQYQVSDTNVADYYSSNLVAGKHIGSTTLKATYLDKIKFIPIVVVPEDSTSKGFSSLVTATISVGGFSTFCFGGSVVLTANAGSSYLWSTRDTTRSIIVTTTGDYTVKVTKSNGLSATSSVVHVTVNPIPGTPTITQNGNQLTSSSSSGNQWYLNGAIIPGATDQNFAPTTSGNYTVQVTMGNCKSSLSNEIVFVVTAVPSINGLEEFKLIPNPSNGRFSIKIKLNTIKDVSFTISNMMGQKIYQSSVYHLSGTQTKDIIETSLSNGVYMLQTRIGKESFIQKIVIAR